MNLTVEFEQSTCAECGISYCVPVKWRKERRDDHRVFYCPNGHGQHFPHESEVEKYKRLHAQQVAIADQLRADRQRLEKENTALKEQKARAKRRIQNGVCPCCNRHFTNLERHMKTKHPETK